MNSSQWYVATSVVLALLLYLPMSRLIRVLGMRRLREKAGRPVTEADEQAQRRRARVLAALIAVAFAFVYNRVLLG